MDDNKLLHIFQIIFCQKQINHMSSKKQSGKELRTGTRVTL